MILYPRGTAYLDEDEVDLINELLDRGFPQAQVEQAAYESFKPHAPKSDGHYRDKARRHVEAVADDRWNWNTHRDPLTMQLAFEGNAAAWWSLNHYERREVVLRLQHLMDNDLRHPNFSEFPMLSGDGKSSGLIAWCRSVGLEDQQHITNPFGRRERIRKANAEAKANALVNA